MTDLYDGRLLDTIQNRAAYNPEVEALAYAMLIEKRRIIDFAKATRTAAVIDQLPEKILDVLAVELRSPYYNDTASIDEKREMIRNSLLWAFKAGTTGAMTEMVEKIFGAGTIVEWFDFDPDDGTIVPGEFDIDTDVSISSPSEYMDQMNSIIDRVKNVRSHLRKIRFLRNVENSETPKVFVQTVQHIRIKIK